MDEVFVLRYTQHEVVTWILCARRMGFIKDLTFWIAKTYLIHRCYEFCPSKNIGCNFVQLAAYKALNEHNYTVAATDYMTDIDESISGIIALSNSKTTCVIGASLQIRKLTNEMCGKCVVNWSEHGIPVNILIVLDVTPQYFSQNIVPLMTLTNTKVIMFGKMQKSKFLSGLAKVQINGKRFFQVIQ